MSSASGPRRHTVVLSDVHLSQAHPRDDADPLWMRYRSSDFHPDAEFEDFVARLLDACGSDPIELVFNGDVLDFDAPVVKNGASIFDEYPLDDAGCTGQVGRILDDHPRFLKAVARLLAAGHRVLFVSGNHDVELYWPGVRRAIQDALRSAARELAAEGDGADAADLADLDERVRFRTWFHVTEDAIYVEHGSQYDMLNGVPDPMVPLTRDESSIHPVLGKLAFKRTGSRMGYLNPYCEETFYMGLTGCVRHFVTHYLFSKRHFVRTFARGAVSTTLEIFRHRRRDDRELADSSVERAVRETNASRTAIVATHALRVPSGERTMLPILRELWLDRIVLAALGVAAVVICFVLTSSDVAAMVAGALAAVFLAYELITPKPDVRTNDSAPASVEQLFDIHGVRAMCMGHTHRPAGTWKDDRFRGNSGAWCPAFADAHCTKPVLDGRPFLWLTAHEEALWGGLHWFRGGVIASDPGGTRPAPRA